MFKVLLALLLPIATSSFNIVFFASVIGQSHISFLKTATDVLIDRGHNVDVVYAHLNDLVKIQTIRGIRRNFTFGYNTPGYYKDKSPHLQGTFVKSSRRLLDLESFDYLAMELCEIAINNPQLLDFLKSGNYDIGITNDYDPCGVIMLKAAGIPSTASLIPTPIFQSQVIHAGLPTSAKLYGTTVTPEHDGSFYDTLFHLARSAYYLHVHLPYLKNQYNLMTRSKFGKDFPDVSELERNIDLILVNSNEIIERPRPISHKIKYIGGMGIKKARPLKESIESILQIPSRGVVLFSFGTQVPTLSIPMEIRKSFVEAFKKFPDYTFIWKYDNLTDDQEIFGDAENIHRLEWLPQTDLLQDSRVKLFISHMGLNSFLETSLCGIPVLAIPLFVDQQNNAQNAVIRQTGIIVNRDELNVENLVEALDELLRNPKYSDNAKIIANMMADKPEKAENEYIQWLEFAAKYPGLHKILNLPGAEYSAFWYYSGDVIIVLILLGLFFLVLVRKTIEFLYIKAKNYQGSKLKQN